MPNPINLDKWLSLSGCRKAGGRILVDRGRGHMLIEIRKLDTRETPEVPCVSGLRRLPLGLYGGSGTSGHPDSHIASSQSLALILPLAIVGSAGLFQGNPRFGGHFLELP